MGLTAVVTRIPSSSACWETPCGFTLRELGLILVRVVFLRLLAIGQRGPGVSWQLGDHEADPSLTPFTLPAVAGYRYRTSVC